MEDGAGKTEHGRRSMDEYSDTHRDRATRHSARRVCVRIDLAGVDIQSLLVWVALVVSHVGDEGPRGRNGRGSGSINARGITGCGKIAISKGWTKLARVRECKSKQRE